MSKKKSISKTPREMSHRQLSHHKRQLRQQRIFLFSGIIVVVAIIGIILGGWVAGEYMPLHSVALEIYETKFDVGFYVDTMVLLAKIQGAGSLSELADSAVRLIENNELIIQEAGKLGFVISDEEAREFLDGFDVNLGINIEVNNAAMHVAKGQLLIEKVIEGHFSSLLPETDVQLHVMAMMVESDAVAGPLRERILAGENFTSLAEQYAGDATSKDILGDYGWHPISILKDKFSSTIPFDYVSRTDAKAGDVSQPLSDNVSYKQWGYWLARVNERQDEYTANVSALYLSSEEEALTVLAKLEAGADLGPIADELSQFSTSQRLHGEIGLVQSTENITDILNGYVFSPDTEIGKWSQPLWDDEYDSRGGFWLVKIADKEENRPLTTQDRNLLINDLYSEWFDKIYNEYSPSFINNLTEDLIQWAVDRVSKQL